MALDIYDAKRRASVEAYCEVNYLTTTERCIQLEDELESVRNSLKKKERLIATDEDGNIVTQAYANRLFQAARQLAEARAELAKRTRERDTFKELAEEFEEERGQYADQLAARDERIRELEGMLKDVSAFALRMEKSADNAEEDAKSLRAFVDQFVVEFEEDFLAVPEPNGAALIVGGPGERWEPIVPLYETARQLCTQAPEPASDGDES